MDGWVVGGCGVWGVGACTRISFPAELDRAGCSSLIFVAVSADAHRPLTKVPLHRRVHFLLEQPCLRLVYQLLDV